MICSDCFSNQLLMNLTTYELMNSATYELMNNNLKVSLFLIGSLCYGICICIHFEAKKLQAPFMVITCTKETSMLIKMSLFVLHRKK